MTELGQDNRESGVSEMVGAIMLISLVVVAVGIIALVLFSQTGPQQIPDVNFMIGTDGASPPKALYLFHNGGDVLRTGEFEVMLDGTSRPFTIEGGGNEWSLGKRLNVDIALLPSIPRQVTLVYNSSSAGAVAIDAVSADFALKPVTMSPDVMVTPTGLHSCSQCDLASCPDLVASQYMQNLTSDSIIFGRSSLTDIPVSPGGGFFNFTVTQPSSSIQISGAVAAFPFPLTTGDKVSLQQAANTGYKIFSIGGEIWDLWATNVNVQITHVNGTVRTYGGRTVSNAMIRGCTIDSTLDITRTAAGAANVLLVMNDTVIRNQNTNDWIILTNIRPTKSGLFSLTHDSNSNVYFVGKADSVTINGVPVS